MALKSAKLATAIASGSIAPLSAAAPLNAKTFLLPAEAVLQMATLDGARALGIDVLTGSLTVGKSADIVAIDLGAPETQPVYHPVSQIVYAAGREQVQHVWIQGRHLLNARRLSTIDLDDTLNRAAAWRDRIHAADERGGATDGR